MAFMRRGVRNGTREVVRNADVGLLYGKKLRFLPAARTRWMNQMRPRKQLFVTGVYVRVLKGKTPMKNYVFHKKIRVCRRRRV